jgi:hypothetical protein
MALNVLAVTDVFLRPIRKNAKHFYGRKKMWVEQGVGMSEANDLALRNPEPPLGGEAVTVLLYAVYPYTIS